MTYGGDWFVIPSRFIPIRRLGNGDWSEAISPFPTPLAEYSRDGNDGNDIV
ncbi:MAG: hypothetical protein V1715_10840 [bacterium]